MGRKLEKYLSKVFIVCQNVYQNMSVCINLDVCVSLMCELRSTESVINSPSKYLFLGKKKACEDERATITALEELTLQLGNQACM